MKSVTVSRVAFITQIIFLGMKLTDHFHQSWWWVFTPTFAFVGLWITLYIGFAVAALFEEK